MKNKFPTTSLFVSVAIFLISMCGFLYLYKEINQNNQAWQMKDTEWRTETLRRENIKKLDDSVKMIEGERMALSTHFAESTDVVPFLDSLEGLAKKTTTKAEITSVDIQEGQSGLYVGMKASGTFNNIYKLLTLIENSHYEIEFLAVDLHKETTATEEGKTPPIPTWNAAFKMKLISFLP